MKQIIIVSLFLFACQTSFAQWLPVNATSTDNISREFGNVSIGTTDAKGYRLAVAGKLIAEEVVIKLKTAWPDYVFTPTYKMPSLLEVESFIKSYKHLPGVPTSEVVEKDGIAVGEMNAILLKKIEEMTLYLIEMKNKNDELSKRLMELENTLQQTNQQN